MVYGFGCRIYNRFHCVGHWLRDLWNNKNVQDGLILGKVEKIMVSIQTAVSTAFQSVQTNVSSMITTCAPYALGIIGTVMAVTIGIKVFKKLTAQA